MWGDGLSVEQSQMEISRENQEISFKMLLKVEFMASRVA